MKNTAAINEAQVPGATHVAEMTGQASAMLDETDFNLLEDYPPETPNGPGPRAVADDGAQGQDKPVPLAQIKTWDDVRSFLRAIYDDDMDLTWTTGFRDIAAGKAAWAGAQGLDHLTAAPIAEGDFYFCIGTMRPGADRRSNANVVAQRVLVADDVGTKAATGVWEELFAAGCPRPSFQIETSPGNETWGWVLAGDGAVARTPERAADLNLMRAYVLERGLSDDVMDDARYIRLPCGWNSKPKYRAAGAGVEASPGVKLVAWRLTGDGADGPVDVDALGAALVGVLDWRNAPMPTGAGARLLTSGQIGAAVGAGTLRRTADINDPEPLILLAREIGLNPRYGGPGVVHADCPNMAAHSARADEGFAFLGNGLAHCHHASCQGLRSSDFRALMVERYDEQIAPNAKPDEPQSGTHFLARAEIERAARKRGTSVTEDAAEAKRSAERMAELGRAFDAGKAAAANKSRAGASAEARAERAAQALLDAGGEVFPDTAGGAWLRYGGTLYSLGALPDRLFRTLAQMGYGLTGDGRVKLGEHLNNRIAPDAEARDVHFRSMI